MVRNNKTKHVSAARKLKGMERKVQENYQEVQKVLRGKEAGEKLRLCQARNAIVRPKGSAGRDFSLQEAVWLSDNKPLFNKLRSDILEVARNNGLRLTSKAMQEIKYLTRFKDGWPVEVFLIQHLQNHTAYNRARECELEDKDETDEGEVERTRFALEGSGDETDEECPRGAMARNKRRDNFSDGLEHDEDAEAQTDMELQCRLKEVKLQYAKEKADKDDQPVPLNRQMAATSQPKKSSRPKTKGLKDIGPTKEPLKPATGSQQIINRRPTNTTLKIRTTAVDFSKKPAQPEDNSLSNEEDEDIPQPPKKCSKPATSSRKIVIPERRPTNATTKTQATAANVSKKLAQGNPLSSEEDEDIPRPPKKYSKKATSLRRIASPECRVSPPPLPPVDTPQRRPVVAHTTGCKSLPSSTSPMLTQSQRRTPRLALGQNWSLSCAANACPGDDDCPDCIPSHPSAELQRLLEQLKTLHEHNEFRSHGPSN
ncbi:hypothetical protein BU15DRAFT_68259 [Melanogaster broomeanus]|nr:hypothetical protein BU15DRAFT_68259 [Melanogaster broomeanus]